MEHPCTVQATRILHIQVRSYAMLPLLLHHFIDDKAERGLVTESRVKIIQPGMKNQNFSLCGWPRT